MGPLSWPEILIILVVLLLLFGAKRLPEMGRSLGRGMREFKDAVTGNEESKPTELSAPTTTAPTPPASPAPTEAAPQQPNSERAAS
jgi:sec-independent protein translocase protein TatA